jgi:hypothetical protein
MHFCSGKTVASHFKMAKKTSAWVVSRGADIYNRADFLPGFGLVVHASSRSSVAHRIGSLDAPEPKSNFYKSSG